MPRMNYGTPRKRVKAPAPSTMVRHHGPGSGLVPPVSGQMPAGSKKPGVGIPGRGQLRGRKPTSAPNPSGRKVGRPVSPQTANPRRRTRQG